MATVKQIELRLKYAKTTIASLTKKLNATKAKATALEAELKKAKALAQKKAVKKPVKKAAAKK